MAGEEIQSPVVELAEVEADVTPRKDIRDDQPAETAPRRGRTRKAGLNPEVSLIGEHRGSGSYGARGGEDPQA